MAEALKQGQTLTLLIDGQSMYPFIRGGVDRYPRAGPHVLEVARTIHDFSGMEFDSRGDKLRGRAEGR